MHRSIMTDRRVGSLLCLLWRLRLTYPMKRSRYSQFSMNVVMVVLKRRASLILSALSFEVCEALSMMRRESVLVLRMALTTASTGSCSSACMLNVRSVREPCEATAFMRQAAVWALEALWVRLKTCRPVFLASPLAIDCWLVLFNRHLVRSRRSRVVVVDK